MDKYPDKPMPPEHWDGAPVEVLERAIGDLEKAAWQDDNHGLSKLGRQHLNDMRASVRRRKGEQPECNSLGCKEPATYWSRSTRSYYCERCAEIINRANDERLCLKIIKHANRNAIAVWREDDAPVPDKETLTAAYQRIYGRPWDKAEKETAIETEDAGDAFLYEMPNGSTTVYESYPGASAIFELV